MLDKDTVCAVFCGYNGQHFSRIMRIVASIIILLLPISATAIDVAVDKNEGIEKRPSGWLPYAFQSESLGTALGVAFYSFGQRQPQSGIVGTGYITNNDSQLLLGSISNYKIPKSDRLFFDVFAMIGHFTDQRFYVDLNKDLSRARAGSNDSEKDNFVSGVSNTIEFNFTVKYPFATGNARMDPVSVYYLDKGLLSSGPPGGDKYDPYNNGKTIGAAKIFYLYRDLDEVSQEELLSVNSSGISLWLDHNNTDFPRNPSKGSRQKFTLIRDFGWPNYSATWTNLELDLTKYFNLGKSNRFRQRVFALNFWTSDTISWETDPNNQYIIRHRPPPGMGSTLGGYYRLRAYPIDRYHDKAAAYYSLELRMIPRIDALSDFAIAKLFKIDWIQLVSFVEFGRVGPEYNSDLFTQHLKRDAGLSLRLMSYQAVVRLDWAASKEGNTVWAMYEQTFAH